MSDTRPQKAGQHAKGTDSTGAPHDLLTDSAGVLQVGGIVVGAATIADGADVAQGTTTNAPVADNTTVASATAATGIALWKRLVNLGIAILASTGKDLGAGWTTVRGVAGVPFTSADQHSAVASVTDAPTSGKHIVITDLIFSTDTAMSFSFSEESDATVIYGPFYLGANQTVNLVTRGKLPLITADKKLQVKTSVAGNISVLALYYSE